jgi:WD40 repeat protein
VTEKFDLAIASPEGPQFSPNGRYFSCGSRLASPKIWETSTRREVAELKGSHEFVSVTFSADGSRLAVGGIGVDAIRIWDLASYRPLLTLPALGSLFRPIQFSPDGNTLGAANLGGILHLWRAPSLEEIEAAEKAQAAPGGKQ